MHPYHALLTRILTEGVRKDDRTGTAIEGYAPHPAIKAPVAV